MSVRSNDPGTTVSPEVFASNLIVLGSMPPVVTADEVQEFAGYHGSDFTRDFFAAPAMQGIRVIWPV